MPTCVPIKDMRDTVKFCKLIQDSPEPVIVTKNGYDAFVVMKSDKYEEMRLIQAKARLLARIEIAEKEITEGKTVDGEAFRKEMMEKYDFKH